MKLFNIVILLFLLSAFAVGSALNEQDKTLIDGAINNASVAIENITIEYSNPSSEIPNIEGLFFVLEKYVKFVGAFIIEILRAGIYFGNDNPEYFDPNFVIIIIKLLVWLAIISLLIKPVGYLLIFIIIGAMFISDKVKNKKNETQKTT